MSPDNLTKIPDSSAQIFEALTSTETANRAVLISTTSRGGYMHVFSTFLLFVCVAEVCHCKTSAYLF